MRGAGAGSLAARGPGTQSRTGSGIDALRALWGFGRPHTLIGTALGVAAVLGLAAAERPGASPGQVAWVGAGTLAAALAANAFIVGLNQLTDVAIDRLNKPELPLPAGRLAPRRARRLVAGFGLVALGLGAALGPWLLGTVAAGMAVGAAYSLPPARLKGSAVGAPAAIALVRGPVATLGLGAHVGGALGGAAWPVPGGVVLLALFMTLFGLAIGVAKDLPDVAGDRAHAVGNLTVRAGARTALAATRALALGAYAATAVGGVLVLPAAAAATLGAGHGLVAAALWTRSGGVDVADRGAVKRFYRGLWRLYYAECALLPAAVLLGGG